MSQKGTMSQKIATADIMDDFSEQAAVLPNVFLHLGGVDMFHGPIVLVRCFEDNSKVKQLLESSGLCETSGKPQVLVVDGHGSMQYALMGDMIAKRAFDNHWAGVVVSGCVRDTSILKTLPLGVCALGVTPRKSIRQNRGEINPDFFNFHGCQLQAGQYLYADSDGLLVLPQSVH